MKTKDIIIENIPVTDQFDTEDGFWKTRACGVAAIKMVIDFKAPSDGSSLSELIKEGQGLNAYSEEAGGWKHSGLVEIAQNHSVGMDYQKIFYYSSEEKNKGLARIGQYIKNGKPVIVSVYFKFEPGKYSHLLIVRGFKKEGNKVTGYYIQDPDSRFRGNRYFVTKEEFLKGWRGGMLWLK